MRRVEPVIDAGSGGGVIAGIAGTAGNGSAERRAMRGRGDGQFRGRHARAACCRLVRMPRAWQRSILPVMTPWSEVASAERAVFGKSVQKSDAGGACAVWLLILSPRVASHTLRVAAQRPFRPCLGVCARQIDAAIDASDHFSLFSAWGPGACRSTAGAALRGVDEPQHHEDGKDDDQPEDDFAHFRAPCRDSIRRPDRAPT